MQFPQILGMSGYPMNASKTIGDTECGLERLTITKADFAYILPGDESAIAEASQELEAVWAGLDWPQNVEEQHDQDRGNGQRDR